MEAWVYVSLFIAGAAVGWYVVNKLIRRWVREEPILPRRKKPDGPSRQQFIESVRWKGEIYCESCGSVLKRVPAMTDWFNTPSYNPMTGGRLSYVEMYGSDGLMICEAYEKTTMASMYSKSAQLMFKDMEKPRHGMYYTDKPPIET